MQQDEDAGQAVDEALRRQARLQLLAFGRETSTSDREGALRELATLQSQPALVAPADAVPETAGPQQRTTISLWLIVSVTVSVFALVYSHLVRVMYTTQISDAPYLEGIPLWFIAPRESAVLFSVGGGVVGLLFCLVFLSQTRWRRTIAVFIALALSAAALLNGCVVLPVLAQPAAVVAQPAPAASDMGGAVMQMFSAAQVPSDVPTEPLPADVVPASVRSLGRLTQTGQAAAYSALSQSGQVCLFMFDELGASAKTCRPSAEVTATGLQTKLAGSFRLDGAENESKESTQANATVTWNPGRGVGVELTPQ